MRGIGPSERPVLGANNGVVRVAVAVLLQFSPLNHATAAPGDTVTALRLTPPAATLRGTASTLTLLPADVDLMLACIGKVVPPEAPRLEARVHSIAQGALAWSTPKLPPGALVVPPPAGAANPFHYTPTVALPDVFARTSVEWRPEKVNVARYNDSGIEAFANFDVSTTRSGAEVSVSIAGNLCSARDGSLMWSRKETASALAVSLVLENGQLPETAFVAAEDRAVDKAMAVLLADIVPVWAPIELPVASNPCTKKAVQALKRDNDPKEAAKQLDLGMAAPKSACTAVDEAVMRSTLAVLTGDFDAAARHAQAAADAASAPQHALPRAVVDELRRDNAALLEAAARRDRPRPELADALERGRSGGHLNRADARWIAQACPRDTLTDAALCAFSALVAEQHRVLIAMDRGKQYELGKRDLALNWGQTLRLQQRVYDQNKVSCIMGDVVLDGRPHTPFLCFEQAAGKWWVNSDLTAAAFVAGLDDWAMSMPEADAKALGVKAAATPVDGWIRLTPQEVEAWKASHRPKPSPLPTFKVDRRELVLSGKAEALADQCGCPKDGPATWRCPLSEWPVRAGVTISSRPDGSLAELEIAVACGVGDDACYPAYQEMQAAEARLKGALGSWRVVGHTEQADDGSGGDISGTTQATTTFAGSGGPTVRLHTESYGGEYLGYKIRFTVVDEVKK